jgi:hypothetical protein
VEIPKFLTEMSEQLNTQNNRITAEPIFMVCYDKWLTCADDRGDKNILLLHDGSDFYLECDDSDHTEIFDYLKEHHEEWALEWLKGESNDAELAELDEYFDLDTNEHDLPEDITVERLAMQKEMTIVKACLTEDDANYFIKRKQHDYAKLYTYVESMNHCPQMIELRNWIKSLT